MRAKTLSCILIVVWKSFLHFNTITAIFIVSISVISNRPPERVLLKMWCVWNKCSEIWNLKWQYMRIYYTKTLLRKFQSVGILSLQHWRYYENIENISCNSSMDPENYLNIDLCIDGPFITYAFFTNELYDQERLMERLVTS